MFRYCTPYYLCVWQHTQADAWGYGLGFTACQPSGTLIDLNTLRFPDGAYVGKGPTEIDGTTRSLHTKTLNPQVQLPSFTTGPAGGILSETALHLTGTITSAVSG